VEFEQYSHIRRVSVHDIDGINFQSKFWFEKRENSNIHGQKKVDIRNDF